MRIRDGQPRPRQDHVDLAARGRPHPVLHERDRLGVESGERGDRDRKVVGEATELRALDELAQLMEERQAGVDHRTGCLDARYQVYRELAQRRERRIEGIQRGHRDVERDRQLVDRVGQRGVLARERARRRVEVGNEVLQVLLVRG